MTPDDFRAPFTTAEGWGTFSQKRSENALEASLEVKWGKLRLRTLALTLAKPQRPRAVKILLNGKPVETQYELENDKLTMTFTNAITIPVDGKMEIAIR